LPVAAPRDQFDMCPQTQRMARHDDGQGDLAIPPVEDYDYAGQDYDYAAWGRAGGVEPALDPVVLGVVLVIAVVGGVAHH
jgi:hypothetical protein